MINMRMHPRDLNLVQNVVCATSGGKHKGYKNKALEAAQAPAFRKFKYIACPLGIQIYIAQITRETKTRVYMPVSNRPLATDETGFNKFGSVMCAGWDRRYFETFREARSYLIFISNLLAAYLKDGEHSKQICEFRNQIELLAEEKAYELDWRSHLAEDDQPRWNDPSVVNTRQKNHGLVRHLQQYAGASNHSWRKFWLKKSVLAGYQFSIRGAQPYWRSASFLSAKGVA